MLDAYHPVDVTTQARDLAEPVAESASFPMPGDRTPRVVKTRKPPQAKERDTIRHGDGEIDLSACVQLVDTSQTRTIAALLPLLDKTPGTLADKARTLRDRIRDEGWEILPRATGSLALPRVQEITAAVNRLR
jgi:predicted ABC-class ATPase